MPVKKNTKKNSQKPDTQKKHTVQLQNLTTKGAAGYFHTNESNGSSYQFKKNSPQRSFNYPAIQNQYYTGSSQELFKAYNSSQKDQAFFSGVDNKLIQSSVFSNAELNLTHNQRLKEEKENCSQESSQGIQLKPQASSYFDSNSTNLQFLGQYPLQYRPLQYTHSGTPTSILDDQEHHRRAPLNSNQRQTETRDYFHSANDKEITFKLSSLTPISGSIEQPTADWHTLKEVQTAKQLRTQDQFLSDMQNLELKRVGRIEKLRLIRHAENEQILTGKPEINLKSKQLIAEKERRPASVKNKKTLVNYRQPTRSQSIKTNLTGLHLTKISEGGLAGRFKSLAINDDQSVSPTPTKSPNNITSEHHETCENLFKQAKEIQIKKAQLSELREQELKACARRQSKKVATNHQSERYYVQKVTRELIKVWQKMEMESEHLESETMTEQMFSTVLLQMGFIIEDKKLKNEEAIFRQRNMNRKLYIQLNGKEREYVTLNNSRMFLFAIQGIQIDHSPGTDRSELQREESNQRMGKMNQFGDIFLDAIDVQKIQQTFKQFNLNRIQFEVGQKSCRKKKKYKDPNCTFKPKINDKSTAITQQRVKKRQPSQYSSLTSRDANTERNQHKTVSRPHPDLKECSFKPMLTSRLEQAKLSHRKFNLNTTSGSRLRFDHRFADCKNIDISCVVNNEDLKDPKLKTLKDEIRSFKLTMEKENLGTHRTRSVTGLQLETSITNQSDSGKKNYRGYLSRDISVPALGDEIFKDLYLESKERKKRRKEISPLEVEFRDQKLECTFKPYLIASARGRSQKHLQKSTNASVKGAEDAVSRLKLGKMIQDRDKEAKSVGKHVNEGPWFESQKKYYKSIKPVKMPQVQTPDPKKYLPYCYSTSRVPIQPSQQMFSQPQKSAKSRNSAQSVRGFKRFSSKASLQNQKFLTNQYPINIVTSCTPRSQSTFPNPTLSNSNFHSSNFQHERPHLALPNIHEFNLGLNRYSPVNPQIIPLRNQHTNLPESTISKVDDSAFNLTDFPNQQQFFGTQPGSRATTPMGSHRESFEFTKKKSSSKTKKRKLKH